MQFVFGNYTLDPDRRELTRGSDLIVIGPRVFDLLLYLVRHQERVVSKQELLHAVWGGRSVSESTMTSHINAVRSAIGDSGSEQRLVRTVARKGFRFVADVSASERPDRNSTLSQAPSGSSTLQALIQNVADRPSIAVLPFLNLSADPEQEFFADGMVDEVIAALARVGWLLVIARNSSFTYKGRAVDVRQVGRELGARYVLDGSIRKAADRVRITGQIVDANTGLTVWSDRFEGSLKDVLVIQDEIAASIVGSLISQLERAEMERAQRKPMENLDAYDYYLRGMREFHQGTRTAVNRALPLFHKVIELDPDYAAGYGMAAWCHVWRKLNGWMTDREGEATEAARLADRAVELGKYDAVALARGGHALGHFGRDLEGCIALLDRALTLNPNLLPAWCLSGFQRIIRGEPNEAMERFARGIALSPLDPEMPRMQAGMGLAYFLTGSYDLASLWAGRALRDLPSFALAVGIVAASEALAGRVGKAELAVRSLGQLDPTLCVSNFRNWVQLQRSEDMDLLVDGLRRSGLPE